MSMSNQLLRAGWRSEDGVATPVEMMYLLIFCIVAVVFLGFVGRLHAAGVQVTNTAQSAARAASIAPDPVTAQQAANAAVAASSLAGRCQGGGQVRLTWAPSSIGTWQGGSVTVQVSCTVRNQSLTGVWAPGVRTVIMRDTQPIDRYQR
jgi:Flp pilus assembly protein TadG